MTIFINPYLDTAERYICAFQNQLKYRPTLKCSFKPLRSYT